MLYKASEVASLCDLTILSGDDNLTLPMMSIGAKGVISVLSNACKDLIAHLMAISLLVLICSAVLNWI